MSNKPFYLTTTLPYVNSDPHIGFALEIVQADIIARYKKLLGHEVFFNTGTDEHGVKIHRKALETGVDTQKYVNEYAEKFKGLKEKLGLLPDINFIRTTDAHHKAAAQSFWKLCDKNGFIYKKAYKIKYCIGCELEKTDSELIEGKCPIHPNLELEIIEEENYFFKFSAFKEILEKHYTDNPEFVIPDFRFNEIKAFVNRGLDDFSISRLKSKMPWGVAVPGDEDHVMYVWFDALVNYISAIGWPDETEKFEKNWPVVQFAGKDNLRQQSAMWQAMLMAAGIKPSKQIIIHGFITSNGQKMSKSLGNVINPYEIVAEYGTDPLRYYLARHISPFEDSDFTMEKFKTAYNADLANGIGNLSSRILRMATSNDVSKIELVSDEDILNSEEMDAKYHENFRNYESNQAADFVWQKIGALDRRIQETQPFKLIKTEPEKAKQLISDLVKELWIISTLLLPFIPETAGKIKAAIKEWKMPEPLFMRK
ncbi:MAG: methionine--tRNA ligase [bacterium]|nr:methionine--tRNA ligase [bacterium]